MVENKLIRALDDLEATGVLQSENRMDLEALLNPPEESRMEGMTDEEICRAVLAARGSQEEGSMDDDPDDDAVVEPRPTYREVLQAASIINRYIEHVNDPVARELEACLASLGPLMRLERSQGLSTTHITDYFHNV